MKFPQKLTGRAPRKQERLASIILETEEKKGLPRSNRRSQGRTSAAGAIEKLATYSFKEPFKGVRPKNIRRGFCMGKRN